MPEEVVQPLDPLGRESSAAEQPAEELPDLVVQSTVDRWKAAITVKDPEPPPRFGIRHIMAWTAFWGIYVAIVRQFLQDDSSPFLLAVLAISGFGSSAAMFGAALFVTRRVLRRNWIIEPGEWLLFIRGWQIVSALVTPLIMTPFDPTAFSWTAVQLMSCVPYVFPLFGKSTPRLWKSLFVLLLVVKGVSVVCTRWMILRIVRGAVGGDILTVLSQLFLTYQPFLPALLPILFAAIDFRRRGQYTWLHWLGIGAGVIEAFASVLWRLNSDLR